MFFFFFFLPRGSFFSHLIIRLRMSVTLFTIPASFLVTKSRSNQGPFTTGSLHLCYFLLCDHCWFYVAFLSTWLLKWNLAFCALSRAATMMGLRATDKMYCCVMLCYASVIRTNSPVALTISYNWYSCVISFLSAFCDQGLFSWSLQVNQTLFLPSHAPSKWTFLYGLVRLCSSAWHCCLLLSMLVCVPQNGQRGLSHPGHVTSFGIKQLLSGWISMHNVVCCINVCVGGWCSQLKEQDALDCGIIQILAYLAP